MKVICNKNTTKLVKGSQYDVLALDTLNTSNSRYFRPMITIRISDGVYGRFSSNSFTNLDGTPIAQKVWKSPELIQDNKDRQDTYINADKFSALKKGDVVICRYPSKYFEVNKMYRISDILDKTERKTIGTNSYDSSTKQIKIEGYNRWINYYRFRLPTLQEKRTLSLGNIFDDTVPTIEVDTKTRKIDRMSDKEKNRVIVSTLLMSMCDTSRNNMSLLDWAIEKKGKAYDLNFSDIKPLMNKKVSDLIKMFE